MTGNPRCACKTFEEIRKPILCQTAPFRFN